MPLSFLCTTLSCVLSYTGGTVVTQSPTYATIRNPDNSFSYCINRNPLWECSKGDANPAAWPGSR
jgi:hypothetical protein